MNFPSSEEIKTIIKKRKNKKSTGPDGIPNIILKNLSNQAIHYLTQIFIHMYNLAYFPEAWKEATIIPILKPKKDPKLPNSYRPISLLSCLSKIYESFINAKIRNHCNDNLTIPSIQFSRFSGTKKP